MVRKTFTLISVLFVAVTLCSCSKDTEETANAEVDEDQESESVPSGGGLLEIDFKGKFYPGLFVYENDDAYESIECKDDNSVVFTSINEEGETSTKNGRWSRIFDGISISVRGEPGTEPTITYYKCLAQDDLFAKASKLSFERRANDESDGQDVSNEDNATE